MFDGISGNISVRDRIALAGRNGTGKTTFLKALLGKAELDSGQIAVGKGMSVGYLPQDGIEGDGLPLIEEVEKAEDSIQTLQQALEVAYDRVAGRREGETADENELEAWETIHRIEGELQLREAHKLRMRTEKVLMGLGFQIQDFERSTKEFSGGWQMRIALAKLLLKHPDYLLLDEPTNHLDLPSQRWLENFLSSYQGGLVIISHDRAFLDSLTRKTFALSRGHLEVYAGNYSYYERESAARKAQLVAMKINQDRQIEKTQDFIDRFRAKATKASQVQSRIKQLEKVERIEIEQDEASLRFRFAETPPAHQLLIQLDQIHKSYGDLNLFHGFDLKIEKGQRLAVVGVNGAGKSTLARIIAGEEPFQSGHRQVGSKTNIGYFAQHQTEQLNPEHSVLESALLSGAGEQRTRDVLGSFLFSGDAAFKKVAVLSGGEKNRLALARMLLKPCNLMVLDEPTNHLDIATKKILQDALREYNGALMIISHDRDFLDPLVTQTLEISPKAHRMFWCNVSAYLDKVEADQTSDSKSSGKTKNATAGSLKDVRRAKAERLQRLGPLKKAVVQAESRVVSLEKQLIEWEDKMKNPEFFSGRPDLKSDMEAYDMVKYDIETAMKEWEEAQAELEEAESAQT
ncbi:MAG: ABC-F family ATP-binding cassette domain-containing protein [Opitutales bacterium]|nr:ABC-F family ATP-binding cassette domain-containing protein [Opitutales bacterium]